MEPSAEFEPSGSGLSPIAIRVLAGLEVGVVGGLPAIAWLLFHSWLRGEPWWAKLNVAGAPFFGPSVYTMGLSRASLAGCALLVLGCGLLGVLFGLLARPQGVARNLVLGLLFAIAWQLACQQYLIKLLDTFAPAYYPPLSTLPAQLMFGIALARFGPRFQALAADWGDPSWAYVPEPPVPPPVEPSDEPSVETPDEPPDEPADKPPVETSVEPLNESSDMPRLDAPNEALKKPPVEPPVEPHNEPSNQPPLDTPNETHDNPPGAAAAESHFASPTHELSSPEPPQIALSDHSESKESKRTQETDC